MRSRFKEFIQTENLQLNESWVGKGFAIGQNRAHASQKTKLFSVISKIQTIAKNGMTEDDLEKRSDLLFSLFLELSNALKIQAEMSRHEINVGTAGVLDANDIRKELEHVLKKR